MDKKPSALVIGVGAHAGLGAALCRKFAAEGYHVFVGGRTPERLDAVIASIAKTNGSAESLVVDATSERDVIDAFAHAMGGKVAEPASLIVYNAGNNARCDLAEMSVEFFENVWRVTCLGGFLVAREATRFLRERGQGTVIFTGATASVRSRPPFTAFASGKAALRAVAQSMARDMGPRGVHVAHVIVDGGINGDKLRSAAPERAQALGDEGMLSPDGLADVYWHLHQQHSSTWTFELDVRPSVENF